MNIAIVDDHPIVADGIRQLLEVALPVDTVLIAHDVEAFKRLQTESPVDLAIVDIALGQDNALQSLLDLTEAFPRLRFLVFSMYDGETYIKSAQHLGAHGFVSKGADHRVLLEAIERVLAGESYFPYELSPDNNDVQLAALSAREKQVLRLAVLGCSPKEISRRLGCAPKTAHSHMANIADKLATRERQRWSELAVYGGMVSPQEFV